MPIRRCTKVHIVYNSRLGYSRKEKTKKNLSPYLKLNYPTKSIIAKE